MASRSDAGGRSRLSPSMVAIIEKQVADLRHRVLTFQAVPNRSNPGLDYSELPDHVDVLVFGPSGSGKSSLIRTFYRALHRTQTIPRELAEKIIVRDTNLNEGTLRYVSAVIKPTGMGGNSTAIVCHDTRGQIWMDSKEMAQVGVILDGQARDDVIVEQRDYRYARLLWEFWKSDTDLFPQEALRGQANLQTKPHAIVFVFDGSMEEVPNDDETLFYRDILQIAREKGYHYPQIVLTRIDQVERTMPKCSDPAEAELKLRQLLDAKIESVVMKLGVSRPSVHFVENYHESSTPESDLSIDFHVLRILHECVQHADTYLRSQLQPKTMANAAMEQCSVQ